jgi:hypothetical protein
VAGKPPDDQLPVNLPARPRINYHGACHLWDGPASAGKHGNRGYSGNAGDSVEFSFADTGIEWLAEKGPAFDIADVYLEGGLKHSSNLPLNDFPTLSNIAVFGVPGLSRETHLIKLVIKTPRAAVDGFSVFS